MPEEEAEAGGGDVVLEGGEDVVIDVAPPDSAAKAAAERKSTGGFDWGDEMEEEEKKDDERFVEIEAKIAVQNEKARARAERFSVEFVEPKLEVILTREEVGIFRAVTKAREPKPEKDESAPQAQRERRGRGRATHTDIMGITAGDEIKGEVRDREYTEALLAKVPPPSPASSAAGPTSPAMQRRATGGVGGGGSSVEERRRTANPPGSREDVWLEDGCIISHSHMCKHTGRATGSGAAPGGEGAVLLLARFTHSPSHSASGNSERLMPAAMADDLTAGGGCLSSLSPQHLWTNT